MPRTALFTIGYEGRALDELIAELGSQRIDRVIDVRELPLSRRRGFSKTPLGEALNNAGIEYMHLRVAGNPFRTEDEPLSKYKRYLAGASSAIATVADAARGHRVALLCYERLPMDCHRSLLAQRVRRKLGVKSIDL